MTALTPNSAVLADSASFNWVSGIAYAGGADKRVNSMYPVSTCCAVGCPDAPADAEDAVLLNEDRLAVGEAGAGVMLESVRRWAL